MTHQPEQERSMTDAGVPIGDQVELLLGAIEESLVLADGYSTGECWAAAELITLPLRIAIATMTPAIKGDAGS